MFTWVRPNNGILKKRGLYFYNFKNDPAFFDVKFNETIVFVAPFDLAGYNITLFTLASKKHKNLK